MDETIIKRLKDFEQQIKEKAGFFIGYPCNFDYDYKFLFNFFNYSLNNVGDPYIDSNFSMNSREFEQEVLDFFADLYEIPKNEFWGYTTSGGTEGNLYGILLGRELLPNGILYSSEDTHYSINKIARLCRIEHIIVPSQENGEINYAKFKELLLENSSRPAIICANIGTTMKGAIDNIDTILDILNNAPIPDYYIHCDGALGGMITPFLENVSKLTFQKNIGSIAISGHKFIGSPIPCGVVITRKKFVNKIESYVEYINTKDTTILGSRNGHSPLFMWYTIKSKGKEGFAQDVAECMKNTQYFANRLEDIGYPYRLNPDFNIILFKKPCSKLIEKWQLATKGYWAHAVVLQHVTEEIIDKFVQDLIDNKNEALREQILVSNFSK